MFRRKEKKKYTFGRFLGDVATAVLATGVATVVWGAEKIHDAVS